MARGWLSADDRRRLLGRGIGAEEAWRQLELLRRPAAYADLVRPCTPGDGVVRIDDDEVPRLHALHEEAARAGRFAKFVPASGVASRMFRDLLHFQKGPGRQLAWPALRERAAAGRSPESSLVAFFEGLPRLALHPELERLLRERGLDLQALRESGDFATVLDALLSPAGLDLERAPKGLLAFHAYPEGGRTPFEEHLAEAVHYVRDRSGVCRLHFTVSPEHCERFVSRLNGIRESYERRFAARFEVGFSEQKPSTDTLAVDLDGQPFRDDRGELVLRPAGHGALIENLNDLEGDLVYVKNIDNVQPDRLKEPMLRWKRTLGGYLVRFQGRAFEFLAALREPEPAQETLKEATRFVTEHLNVEWHGENPPRTPECRRAFLIDRLDRPLRVCGVVRNTGEPGGGPFWVRRSDGSVGPQIVEDAQIDPDAPDQQRILRDSTHFNPVDLVCALRDLDGRPFDLHSFIDNEAAIVARKSFAGRELRSLERPGLWNGAMAGWNTLFVEVPLETFSPVKTVLDLLRDEHGPA